MSKLPVVFSGHGDPMIALRTDAVTRGMQAVGQQILDALWKAQGDSGHLRPLVHQRQLCAGISKTPSDL